MQYVTINIQLKLSNNRQWMYEKENVFNIFSTCDTRSLNYVRPTYLVFN